MTALNAHRRKQTARELADRFNRSPRTIRRIIAEPREEFEARAAERHARIREMRAEGKTMRAIAAELEISVGAVHYAISKSGSAA